MTVNLPLVDYEVRFPTETPRLSRPWHVGTPCICPLCTWADNRELAAVPVLIESGERRVGMFTPAMAPGAPGDPTACTCNPARWRGVPADRIRHEPTCPRRIKSPR